MRPAGPGGAARGVPARGEPAAAQHGLARRQPAPGDALLVLAARTGRAACTAATSASRSEGEHREHAIFANDFCASAHPSDVAAALLALDATLRTTGASCRSPSSTALPTEDDRRTTTLEPGELILEVERARRSSASVYLKAMERKRWAFPLVGVAAARRGGATRVALAGVAPIPWLLDGRARRRDAAAAERVQGRPRPARSSSAHVAALGQS